MQAGRRSRLSPAAQTIMVAASAEFSMVKVAWHLGP
jgi:hypothetical protein